MSELVIRGGVIVTVDPEWSVLEGDVVCLDGVITRVGGTAPPATGDYQIIDAEGCIVMPGLVQSHVHMCQTLARGRADDLELLDWLRTVVWPYEGALDEADVASAARLACVELLLGGTTAIQDMGTVHHTDALFEVARDAGIRATIGKAMMDDSSAGHPPGLQETAQQSLDESIRLCEQWHRSESGRLRYAFAPRFALSCSDALLRNTAVAARERGARLHTHSSENRDEIALVRKLRGADNIAYLHDVGMTGHDVGLAHCVWLSEAERALLQSSGTHVLHCPSSNLKLASGIAQIPELIEQGIAVSLGADGAPCNNNLDGFLEMRLAALIHKPRAGARAMRAAQVVKTATLDGARALGLDHLIGSIEANKRADIIVVNAAGAHVQPTDNPYSALVYACRSTDVRHVIVDGTVLIRDHELLTLDASAATRDAHERAASVFGRM
jgi:cytosine/adenosine deaminase-related metal-dependent hydrolase